MKDSPASADSSGTGTSSRPSPEAEGIHKLRIRHPSGAEFEAEGSVDFILSEKRQFISGICQQQPPQGARGGKPDGKAPPGGPQEYTSQNLTIWHKIAVFKQNILVLTIKSPELAKPEAPLLILAAAQDIGSMREYPAVRLSKSMKASGYLPERLDRLLLNSVKEGKITALGTKRNRSYRLTSRGLAEALSIAGKLLEIHG